MPASLNRWFALMATAAALAVAAAVLDGWIAQVGASLAMAMGGFGGGMWLRGRQRPETVEAALERVERRRRSEAARSERKAT